MTVERLSGANRAVEVAEQLDRAGVVCLQAHVSPDLLNSACREVRELLAANGGADFSVVDVQNRPELSVSRIVTDAELKSLVTELARIGCPDASGVQDDVYGVLNVATGRPRRRRSPRFHFDSNTVAAVIALIIPSHEAVPSGELALFANWRPFRRSVVTNILEKLRLVDPRQRRRLRSLALDPRGDHLLRLQPGNAYVFWGYRALHAAMPPAPGTLRATLVVHCGNPHGASGLLAFIRGVRSALAPRTQRWR